MRTDPALAAAAFLLGVVGCTQHGVAHDLAFQAPKGWTGAPSPFGAQVYVKAGTHETVMTREVQPTRPAGPARGETWTAITICGDRPANLATFTRAEYGRIDLWEGVDTTWNGHRYMAVYVRPKGDPADPQAEAAIRSLCARR